MRADVEAWIKRAEEDLFTAKALMEFKKPVPWIVCFHAQQAAEKFLKAFLIHHYRPVSKTHDIKALILECSKIDPSFRKLLKEEVDRLTEYAVETRYPVLLEPTIEEAREALELASKVRDFVLGKFEQRNP